MYVWLLLIILIAILTTFLAIFKNEKAFKELIKIPDEATESTTWLQDVVKKYDEEQKQKADEHEKFMQGWRKKFYSQKRTK